MSLELKIALVQSALIWEDPDANRAMFAKKIAAIRSSVDLIVLPEMFTTGFTMSPKNIASSEGSKTVKWMQRISREKNVAITGSIVFTENDENYNRLFFCFPNGKYEEYDKKHTFTLAGEHEVYTAGKSKLIVQYKGFKLKPLICYDLRFPVWSRNTEDYDIILYVANWPKPRIDAWDTLLKARAIENMSYCIGVNRIGLDNLGHEYSGHSAVYDTLGNQISYSEDEEILYATLVKQHIDSTRNKLKFLEDRDDFNLI
ncbi:Hydrolase YafV [Flagellimonas maritima]|uniref:Omega-amidase YafV n=1 Tax=Flagellimonas maritima TaxID=1383885 RepID=A0A2Z4LSD1_9FLAO|nr:amidohydrolase [Allomuricauda aurantiaca]AWX44248.1 Hydrolase YafV [Allomuricauda aurantiaca]